MAPARRPARVFRPKTYAFRLPTTREDPATAETGGRIQAAGEGAGAAWRRAPGAFAASRQADRIGTVDSNRYRPLRNTGGGRGKKSGQWHAQPAPRRLRIRAPGSLHPCETEATNLRRYF